MRQLLKHKLFTRYALLAILLLAAALRFWGIAHLDVQHDHAINSFRALGWFDYLVGEGQTAPIIWFGKIPWWGYLSFHDHPPLVFLTQFISFVILGEGSIGAFMPFILAGIGTIYLLYRLLKKFSSVYEGLLAALLMTISSYAIWASRTGYLEGVQLFFITLSIYFLISYSKTNKNSHLYLWWSSIALALLSKYTSAFLLPSAFFYFIVWHRDVFKKKAFWLGGILALTLLSTTIVYNIKVYQTRGHFDAAFSSMIGMQPDDYSVISQRSISTDFISSALETMQVLQNNVSYGLLAIYIASILYLIFRWIKEKRHTIDTIVILNLFFMCVMLLFLGGSARFLSILLPLLTLSSARAMYTWLVKIKPKRPMIKNMSVILFSSILIFEGFYAINSNLTRLPIGMPGITFGKDRYYDSGFTDFENYLQTYIIGTTPKEKRKINEFTEDILRFSIKNRDVVLIDERINWFSRMWYDRRYYLYYNMPFIYLSELDISYQQSEFDGNQLEWLKSGGANNFWLIVADDRVASGLNPDYWDKLHITMQSLKEASIEPIKIINDYTDQPAIYIYNFDIDASQ